MPTPTYIPLATITLNSSVSSVTFSNIPATYRDLVLVVNSIANTTSESYSSLRFNADAGTNYSRVEAFGNGSTAGSATFPNLIPVTMPASNSGIWGNSISYIMDYSATDKHKTVIYRNNTSNSTTVMGAGRWANTSAITTVAVIAFTNQLGAGTTLNLYGIAS